MLNYERLEVARARKLKIEHPLPAIEIRRRSLALLAEQWGGITNLAKQLGVTPGYISQLLSTEQTSNSRTITEKTATKFEDVLGLSRGWMSEDHREPKAPAPINTSLITRVILAVGAQAEEIGITLAPQKFADVVTLVYEDALRTQTIDQEYIARVLRLVRN